MHMCVHTHRTHTGTGQSGTHCLQLARVTPWQAPVGRLPVLPLVEAVLGAVVGAQLPDVLQVVVPQQPAQDVQGLVQADLVVPVLCLGQLSDEVRHLPALRSGQRVHHLPDTGP